MRKNAALRLTIVSGILSIALSHVSPAQESVKVESLVKASKDTTWKNKTEFGANFNQGSFSDNWTGGGVNSIAFGVFFNALRQFKKDRHTWRNDLQTQYGIVKNKGQNLRKNFDRLFLDSKYGYDLGPKWAVVANVNLLSQFAPGYDYTLVNGEEVARKMSGLFSPAYITEAIGIQYSPVPYFYVTLSPGAIRQTIVLDTTIYKYTPDLKNYGVPIGKKLQNDMSVFQLVANFDKNLVENVNLKFRYVLFAQTLGEMDNRLDIMFTAKVNKYINVNLGAIAIYDQDQSNKIQIAQSLGLGFLYNF